MNIERLTELLAAATPGPWRVEYDEEEDARWPWRIVGPKRPAKHIGGMVSTEVVNLADANNTQVETDADLIVSLRNAAPELLGVVEAALGHYETFRHDQGGGCECGVCEAFRELDKDDVLWALWELRAP